MRFNEVTLEDAVCFDGISGIDNELDLYEFVVEKGQSDKFRLELLMQDVEKKLKETRDIIKQAVECFDPDKKHDYLQNEDPRVKKLNKIKGHITMELGKIFAIDKEPQIIIPEKPIRQFTKEQVTLLKSYFVAAFNGAGQNINYFDDLLVDLQKKRDGIGYAKIAKMIYESPKSVGEFKSKPFEQWYETFCNLMGIKKLQYRISRIIIDNAIRSDFYYLT